MKIYVLRRTISFYTNILHLYIRLGSLWSDFLFYIKYCSILRQGVNWKNHLCGRSSTERTIDNIAGLNCYSNISWTSLPHREIWAVLINRYRSEKSPVRCTRSLANPTEESAPGAFSTIAFKARIEYFARMY